MVNKAKAIIGAINPSILISAIVAGVVLYVKWDDFTWFSLPGVKVPIALFLVASALALISALVGIASICPCAGKKLKGGYLAIILIVIILEIVGIAIAYVFQDDLLEKVQEAWDLTAIPDVQQTRALIEAQLGCCGWLNATEADCGYNATNETKTCKDQVTDQVKSSAVAIAIALIVLVALELALLISAIYLLCSDKPDADGLTKF
jgi:hypothetical protein